VESVHHLHPRLMGSTHPLRVLLVGAGGSGSAVLLQLPFLEQALRAWGQPGLAVTVMDPDVVSEVNVVRQPFSRVDIGSNNADQSPVASITREALSISSSSLTTLWSEAS